MPSIATAKLQGIGVAAHLQLTEEAGESMLAIWAVLWLVAATVLIADLARPSHWTFWRRFLVGGMLMASGGFLSYTTATPTWGNLADSLELAGGISMAISVAIMAGTRLSTAVQQANAARTRHSHRDRGP